VTARKAPARRCTWRDCAEPAAATVAFELPNLLAGSRRDYCAAHTSQACKARGTVLIARFGARQPALPGLLAAPSDSTPRRDSRRRKEVVA
jgi:hypothetical protein